MKKVSILVLLSLVVIGFYGSQLNASSVNFKYGLFHPAMQSDLWEVNMENLSLSKQDMRDSYFGVEFEYFLNRNISFSAEGGYYSKDHYSFYKDYEYDNGDPIYQNLELRIINMEVGLKLYPLGHRQKINPYLGFGGGMYYWKYEQWGDFIDFENWSVNEDEYAESSTFSPGFFAEAGLTMRFSRTWGISLEGKYQYLKGQLSSFFEGFGNLDLNGLLVTVGINLYF